VNTIEGIETLETKETAAQSVKTTTWSRGKATRLTAFALALGAQCIGLATAATDPAPAASGRLQRDGMTIEFEARPVDGGTELVEAAMADIRFRITDSANGRPISGLAPGVWLDVAQNIEGKGGEQKECKEKIALYLKGLVGIRPMLDLNSYHLLILNKDASLTVIDPIVSVAGKTSTFGTVVLRKPPMDWARSAEGKRLFVSMPLAGQVAVVETERFKVVTNIDAGKEPVRVSVQPDGRYLWVGNNGRTAETSGVTVIDTQSLKPVLTAPTGRGHHEIAFSRDSRFAFVSNRDEGTVSVFDVAGLKKVADIKTGPRPISLAYSPFAEALFVADGEAGTVSVIDGETLATRHTIALKPGLGPLRFAPDERYAFVLNPKEGTATVIDAASDSAIHTLEVAAEPYQVSFTRAYAYIRGLGSERVSMVSLSTLGAGKTPSVLSFAAGDKAPRLAGDLPIADSISPANVDAGVFVVNPVDNTTYFYMEGMNAPMAGYPNRGHTARGAIVVARSIKEVEPGVFATRAKLPVAGKFDVAFLLDRPRVLHCFSAQVTAAPELERAYAATKVTFALAPQPAVAKSAVPVRVRLTQGRDATPRTGLTDLSIRYFQAPASAAKTVAAKEVGDGVYEALVEFAEPGAYYLHAGAASIKLGFGDQPYASLRVSADSSTNGREAAK
jgi:YVTN family beta-propeller protein